MKKLIIILTFFLTLISHKGIGQNNIIGLSSGNYAGIYGVYNNPAYIQNNFSYNNISILGIGMYINNNYLVLRKEDHSLLKFMSLDFSFPTFVDENGKDKEMDDIYNKSLKQAYQKAFVNGISYMQSYNNFGFSISTRGRMFSRVKNLSYNLAKLIYEDLNFEPLHNIIFDNQISQSIEQLSVTEIAAGLAYNIKSKNYTKIDIGFSAKYLMPISGVKLYIDNVNYYLIDRNTLTINELNGTFDASFPYDFNTKKVPGTGGWIKGSGFGFDFGIFITKTKKIGRKKYMKRAENVKKVYYKYRIGLSINDIGLVYFNNNALSHKYKNASTFWPNIRDIEYENIYGLMETISQKLTGDPQETNTGKTSFKKRLPTYFNLQFDYSFSNNLFLNSMFTYNLNAKHNGFEKPDYMAIMPRFEKASWSFGIPISLHDYRVPQIGFHARFYFLSFGVENIIPYLGFDDINAGDFYISINYFLEKGFKHKNKKGCIGYEYRKFTKHKKY